MTYIVVFYVGHRIEQTPEVPLVINDKVEEYKKTKEAVQMLKRFKAWNEIEKVSEILEHNSVATS